MQLALLLQRAIYIVPKGNRDPMHCYYFFISTVLKAVLSQYELFTDRKTRDDLALTIGNGDPMHGMCIRQTIPRAWEQKGLNKLENQIPE